MDGGRPAKAYEDKTEIILIGTQQQLDKVNIARLEIGQASRTIIASSAVRNLGSWFDVNLKMTEQINKTCQSVYYHLRNIRQIRKFLTPASTKLLIQGVIMARIDYCNGLLYSVLAVILQRLQNSTARLITHTPSYCHITPVLLALKAIYSLAPAYISNLIHIKQCSCYNLRSNAGVISQDPTTKFKCTLGDKSFTAASPKIWNGLPDHSRKENDFDKFKRLIMTHYFKKAYSDVS